MQVIMLSVNSCLTLSDPRTFQDFVRAIGILGGTDFPEDIMGGFKVTFTDLNWRSESCKVAVSSKMCDIMNSCM